MKTFIFDFDSTIFPGETLDEIITFGLKNDLQKEEKSREISEICNLGMSGEIPMKESLKRRLEIAAPTKEIIANYVAKNQNRIVPKFRGILKNLQGAGHQVLVVSGGFEEWIVPLLKEIITSENIHANKIKNREKPMLFENIIRRDKEEIIENLLSQENPPQSPFIKGELKKSREIFMIGDGATDFSIFERGMANHFIGAGFYENREKIREKAAQHQQLFFTNLDSFIKYFANFLT